MRDDNMIRRLRKRLGVNSPGITVAVIALILALTGGAFAANSALTGKQKKEAPIQGTRFDRNPLYLNRYWHDATFAAVDQLKEIAQKAGRSMVSLALSWVLHHTPATGMIIGATRKEQLTENLTAVEEGKLDDETVAACDAVWTNFRGVSPKWSR